MVEAAGGEIASVSAEVAAVEGTTGITPKPIAGTVTGPMRLKVVFVEFFSF